MGVALGHVDGSRANTICPATHHEKLAVALTGARVRFAAEKFAGAGAAGKVSVVDDDAPAGEHGLRYALHADSLEHGIVDAHLVRLRADHLLRVGIENHDVRVRADGDRAFARV